MNRAEYEARIATLESENQALRTSKFTKPTPKVSVKGAVSIYGLGKFPVTLYKEQWLRLFAAQAEIMAFITANDSKLSVKPKADTGEVQ